MQQLATEQKVKHLNIFFPPKYGSWPAFYVVTHCYCNIIYTVKKWIFHAVVNNFQFSRFQAVITNCYNQYFGDISILFIYSFTYTLLLFLF